MLTWMHATACGPDYILRAGKVYDLPRAIAKKMADAKMIGAAKAADKPDKDGKYGVLVSGAGPCATIISADELPTYLKKGQKVLKMNARPDPEETVGVLVDDDAEVESIGDE